MKKNRCAGCKEYFDRETMIRLPSGLFHSIQCAVDLGKKRQEKQVLAARNKVKKQTAKRHASDKERVKTRTQWLDQLQSLVNQYVLHVRDKGRPCCTCGKPRGVKFDAGHMRSRGSCPELRFELTNIHAQCSVNCNQHGSGMRHEYQLFIIAEYGQEHLEWLEGPHAMLKEQFPHYTDIKAEIIRYRKLIRGGGLKPNR